MAVQDSIRRPWFQFRLRSLLIFTTIACVGFAAVGRRLQLAREQRAVVETIRQLGGWPIYDYKAVWWHPSHSSWLWDGLGPDFFVDVTEVHFEQLSRSDDCLAMLSRLPTVEFLSFRDVDVTERTLLHLKAMSRLNRLGLFGNQVSDVQLERLKHLPKLKSLTIQGRFTDAGLVHLLNLTELRDLFVNGDVTDDGIAHLVQLKALKTLTLYDCITETGVSRLRKEMPAVFVERSNTRATY